MRLHTGVYGHRRRACTESWLWKKNSLWERYVYVVLTTSVARYVDGMWRMHWHSCNLVKVRWRYVYDVCWRYVNGLLTMRWSSINTVKVLWLSLYSGCWRCIGCMLTIRMDGVLIRHWSSSSNTANVLWRYVDDECWLYLDGMLTMWQQHGEDTLTVCW